MTVLAEISKAEAAIGSALHMPPQATGPAPNPPKDFAGITTDLGSVYAAYQNLRDAKLATAQLLTKTIEATTVDRDAALAVAKQADDTATQIASILTPLTPPAPSVVVATTPTAAASTLVA